MTGPDHYLEAEELTEKAREYLGQGDEQESAAVWAAVAQVHATLALAAASALGTMAAESRPWADVAGTRLSAAGS
jgi:predicted trehalose synthase